MPRITERIDRRLFRLANRNRTTARVLLWVVFIYVSGFLSGAASLFSVGHYF